MMFSEECHDMAQGALVFAFLTGCVGAALGWLACKASMFDELRGKKNAEQGEK